jgi:hypothetical protein
MNPPLALQVLKSDFIVSPAMRKNGIEWNLRPEELMELKGCCIQEAHNLGSTIEVLG